MTDTVHAAAEPAAPVILRASPRVVVGHLRLGALSAVVAGLGWWLRLNYLPLLFAVSAAGQLYWWLHGAVGRVELGPDAVRVRRLFGVTTVQSGDVARFAVHTKTFGRHVRLERYAGRAFRLPAPVSPRLLPDPRFDEQVEAIRAWCRPRFGGAAGPAFEGRRPRWVYPVTVLTLGLAAALADRPWGWVATAEAAELPQPCEVLRQPASTVVGSASGEPLTFSTPDVRVTGCRWPGAGDRELLVVMTLYARSGLHSAESVATAHLLDGGPGAYGWSTGTLRPLPHATRIGDATLTAYIGRPRTAVSVLGPNTTDDSPVGGAVLVRTANVIIEAYLEPADDEAAQDAAPITDAEVAGLLTVARAAADSVAVR
ncbi:hypothetical protein ACNTMW_33680 [Planosporangium sp. 12N6]|uniref:hypothetical protein n=1 Tax=Planosporangium spinosum TaxID=3402278 RepID=UPI003CF9A937